MKTKRILQIVLILTLALGLMAACTVSASAAGKTISKVTGLKATATSDTTVSLSWSKAKNAKKYEVQYKKSGDKKYKSYKTTKSKKLTVKNLKANTKYYFKVRGINGKKKGQFSSSKSAKTYPRPDKVKGIYASYRDKGEIILKWNPTKNATYYDVERKEIYTGYIDRQSGDSEQTGPDTFVQLHQYTAHLSTPYSWCEFKVRGRYQHSEKSKTVYGSWSDPFYVCTLAGNRMITGKPVDNSDVIEYEMNDIFDVGVDDTLIPQGVYEQHQWEGDEIEDSWYDTDYMLVDGVSFPDDFTESGSFDKNDTDNSNFDEELDGKSFYEGDIFDGKEIEKIYVEPNVNEGNVVGNKVVIKIKDMNMWYDIVWK